MIEVLTPVRVLLVDDDEDEFVLTRHRLAEIDAAGFDLEWAPDYETARDTMARQHHDVYLVDYRLGDRSGLDLLAESQDAARERPVIVLTGVGNREVDLEAMRLGATSYLAKAEIDARVLERTIRYTIEIQRARADQRQTAERLRRHGEQQSLLAELGRRALASMDSMAIMHEAARVAAQGLHVEVGAFFELRPDDTELALRAAHGWPDGTLAPTVIGVDTWPGTALHAPAPALLEASTIVASELQTLGFAGGASTAVRGQTRALGLLVALGTRPQPWAENDGAFLEAAAQILVQGLERNRAIEEQARLQERLRRSEVMSAMGALVAGVAHETRNPLFGITATLDALVSRFGGGEEMGRYVSVLKTEVQRLNALMSDLMEYGRPRAPDVLRESLAPIVAEAVRACAILAERLDVSIVNGVGTDLPAIDMDPRRLVHALQNVIQNAMQHSPKGATVTISAEATTRAHGPGVVCRVEDAGPGFAANDLARIFEPFFTRREGGTGLGLAIAHRIVEEHGGTIGATNGSAGGAVVAIELPVSARPS